MNAGQKVHVFAEQSGYLGRCTIEAVESTGNVIVAGTFGRGRVRPDQCFATKRAAMTAAAVPGAGWAAAALLGTKAGR